jgi:hypothetical protein
MTRALLQAGCGVPWSAVRRTHAAAEALTEVTGCVRLSQLRAVHERALDGLYTSAACGAVGAAGLQLGCLAFGGYSWRVELVCCLAEEVQRGLDGFSHEDTSGQPGQQAQQPLRPLTRDNSGGTPSKAAWRLGLRVSAAPLLGAGCAKLAGGGASSAGPVSLNSTSGLIGQQEPGDMSRQLLAVGAAKAADAAARHITRTDSPPGSAATCGSAAAFDVVAGVRVAAAERVEALDNSSSNGGGAFQPLLLSERCDARDGGAAWCMRARARGGVTDGVPREAACGLCRRGTVTDALAASGMVGAPGDGAEALTVFSGWRPERWSALAPAGQLQWRCSLRLLTDY